MISSGILPTVTEHAEMLHLKVEGAWSVGADRENTDRSVLLDWSLFSGGLDVARLLDLSGDYRTLAGDCHRCLIYQRSSIISVHLQVTDVHVQDGQSMPPTCRQLEDG